MWPCDRISGSLYCHLAFHCTHLPLRIHSPVEGNLHEYKFSFCLDKYVEVRFLGLMLFFFYFPLLFKKLLLFFSFKKKCLRNCQTLFQSGCFILLSTSDGTAVDLRARAFIWGRGRSCALLELWHRPPPASAALRVAVFKQESPSGQRWHRDYKHKGIELEFLQFCSSL